MSKILIVEDDDMLRDGLTAQLAKGGFVAAAVGDAELALRHLQDNSVAGVILDLGLPRMNGMQVLAQIRQDWPALPVLILTARDSLDDRVQGLNLGADDYMSKPFSMDELLARVAAMLRRAQLPAFTPNNDVVCVGELKLDARVPLAWLSDKNMELTQREWSLLGLLLSQIGQVVTREAVTAVWQGDAEGLDGTGLPSNALEVYVHRLRRKLVGSAFSIRNVRGLGYMLEQQAITPSA